MIHFLFRSALPTALLTIALACGETPLQTDALAADARAQPDGSGSDGSGSDGNGPEADGSAGTDAAELPPDATPIDAASPTHVVIHFDELGSGTNVTSHYAEHATFSSTSGYVNRTSSTPSVGQSPPNFLCSAAVGGALSCERDTYIDFTVPVSQLRLRALGTGASGKVAELRVFTSGSLAATEDLIGSGNTNVPVAIDLTAYSEVTRLELAAITDPYGIAWDDLEFDKTP